MKKLEIPRHFRGNGRVTTLARSPGMEVFQVNARIRQQLRKRKRRIRHRLRKRQWAEQCRRMFKDRNVHYDLAERAKGLRCAGLGVFQLLAQRLQLADALDARVHLLKRHVPYFESDHILNLAYNLLAGGKTLDDLELLRNNENYLDVLGAQRIPDPTTAGDFLRRFGAADIDALMDVVNDKRLLVWKQQPDAFFEQAVIEADGSIVETTGKCKRGIDLSYKGQWGYHPLLVSLANTQEVLFLLNRPGNRPSHEGAAAYLDRAADLCRRAGFRKILFRGDTDFSQTAELDRWDKGGIGFVFGIDAQPGLVARAERLPERVWAELHRPPGYTAEAEPRQRPADVKGAVVRRRGFRNVRLVREGVAEFNYRPAACAEGHLVVVLRKQLAWERHGVVVEEETRYFFYVTNQWSWPCAEVVSFANDRGNQENLIEQLKNGVRALRAPVNTLESNWAYMVIGALAWNLKAWLALVQPRTGYGARLLAMEFRTFLEEVVLLPCQVVRAGRCLIYRLLQWNPWVEMLCKVSELLRTLRLT
jgi:Transposase DDE domain group 1